ncbi:MAG: metallophosphoesterase family protein [Lachnospiraceae bacterium]|nr:metallophosphoesterase family protein [Lachnospiraceae bacterium]
MFHRYYRYSEPSKLLSRAICTTLENLNYFPGLDRIRIVPLNLQLTGVPEPWKGTRMAIISDLHAHYFGKDQIKLKEAMESIRPDLILVAGDWIRINYEEQDRMSILSAAKALASVAPVYSNYGNHEIRARGLTLMQQELSEAGICFLLNETVSLQRDNTQILMTGFTTPYVYYHGKDKERAGRDMESMGTQWSDAMKNLSFSDSLPPLTDAVDASKTADIKCISCTAAASEAASFSAADSLLISRENTFRIAIAHRPELLPLYASLGPDLVITGHAHGGLMKLGPVRVLAPDQGLFPKMAEGIRTEDKTTMVISEGLGGPRVGIRPQILVLEL